jgi:ATP-dependent Clp protease ATP-binding subunit ClpC
MQYANVLDEGRDVIEAARACPPALFREREVRSVIEAISSGRSVLLVGPSGVGKSAVLNACADRVGDLGYRVRQFTVVQIMSGTRYLGEWQSKLSVLMTEAVQSRTILNIIDVVNLASAGISSNSTTNFLDAMRPQLASGCLLIIGEVTPEQLQSIYRIPNFASLFDLIHVEPLSADEIVEIVDREANAIGLALDAPARDRLMQLCNTFQVSQQGPGAALDLIDRVKDYRDQKSGVGEPADITPSFIEKVFAIYSGLPLFVVSRSESKPTAQIRDWFRERIIGQEAAIEAVVEMIALYKSRLHDKTKPIGSFLFVGPTGVGKTELARALAQYFFGSERRMLRFDMSEFAEYAAFEMLVGNPREPERPARLVDPVRAQPFQVVLFDELEKGHRTIQDLLLQLLDEGRLSTPKGETVNFCSTIIIATTNAGASEGTASSIGFGRDVGPTYDPDKVLHAIGAHFRPEFINRFQHVVLFHPLSREQAAQIARIELRSLLKREGITERNLIVDVTDDAIELVLAAGFNASFGARAIKREVRRQIILPIATLLMEREVVRASLIQVGVRDGRIAVAVADTPESSQIRAEREPIRTATGERLTRKDVGDRIAAARVAAKQLFDATGVEKLRSEIREIDVQRKDYRFWHDATGAGQILARQIRSMEVVSRVERLMAWIDELSSGAAAQTTRSQLNGLAAQLVHFEAARAAAQRELVRMSPEGYWDALVEIAPTGGGIEARDFMFKVYATWARDRRLELVMVREPMAADEPIVFAVRGHFPYGYLKAEAGYHRVRQKREASVARIAIAPWLDLTHSIELKAQRALKAVGQLGGKIRSRVEVSESNLVLQNERTLNENSELARDLAPSWELHQQGVSGARMVRRYDLKPFLVRDYLTSQDFTRADILAPKLFHELLCARVDKSAAPAEA